MLPHVLNLCLHFTHHDVNFLVETVVVLSGPVFSNIGITSAIITEIVVIIIIKIFLKRTKRFFWTGNWAVLHGAAEGAEFCVPICPSERFLIQLVGLSLGFF